MFIALSLLFAAVCFLPAIGKLLNNPKIRKAAAELGIPWSRYRLIAVPELAATAGAFVGLFWRPAGILAAAGMSLLLLGAVVVHRRAHPSVREAVPAIVALAITIAYLVAASTA
jgi:hypothetical protein